MPKAMVARQTGFDKALGAAVQRGATPWPGPFRRGVLGARPHPASSGLSCDLLRSRRQTRLVGTCGQHRGEARSEAWCTLAHTPPAAPRTCPSPPPYRSPDGHTVRPPVPRHADSERNRRDPDRAPGPAAWPYHRWLPLPETLTATTVGWPARPCPSCQACGLIC